MKVDVYQDLQAAVNEDPNYLHGNWNAGTLPASAKGSAILEPTTLALLGLGVPMLLCRRSSCIGQPGLSSTPSLPRT